MNFKRTIPVIAVMMALAALTWTAGARTASPMVFEDGKAIFSAKCASCHGMDGSGNTAKGKEFKLKDLKSAEVQKKTDAQLIELTTKGKGKMPAYDKSLGKEKIEAVVAYVRQLAKK